MLSRRRFLAVSGFSLSFPTLVSSGVLGRAETPPSRRITMGIVGCGGMGTSNARAFLAQQDCQVVAACDVDKLHLDSVVKLVNKKYGNEDCKGYSDYRKLMERKDIDTVMLALPDHWHALPAIEAARISRKPAITPVETAHHSAVPGHLGLISMLVRRKIRWDAQAEKIIEDAEASRLLTRPYRLPLKLA